jgi:hypothetical protein
MVSANTLCKMLLNVKNAVVEGADFYTDALLFTTFFSSRADTGLSQSSAPFA